MLFQSTFSYRNMDHNKPAKTPAEIQENAPKIKLHANQRCHFAHANKNGNQKMTEKSE